LASLGTNGSAEEPVNPNIAHSHRATPARRASRMAKAAKRERTAVVAVHRSAAAAAQPVAGTAKKRKVKGGFVNLAVMVLAGGIVATMALPAYAFNPQAKQSSQFGTSVIDGMKAAHSQSVTVDSAAIAPAVAHDSFAATTAAQLQSAQDAAQAAANAAQMQAYGAAYSGPSASDYLKNPPYPKFSLSQVFQVAKQYIGVPYVYGGSTPAGFDCSGFTMFVYAQFGVNLPHSSMEQGQMGTRISIADAQPGDLVIMLGGAHVGFYAGNGNILDAPDVGRSISIRPIWTSDYYIVRMGI
jgi:Cell wall-associated hydrolases (invasion-associated proteins)